MNKNSPSNAESLDAALDFQASILEGVSRTFALTIPSLPEALRIPVTNAYLLCRIADTIEDDAGLDPDEKRAYANWFVDVVRGDRDATPLAGALAPRLASATLDEERRLIANSARVIRVTHSFAPVQRDALLRCVALMSDGMHRYQRAAGRAGLKTLRQLDEYCYYVAGVVGEMLTELFCAHAPDIARRRDGLMKLAPSFGQGLQMTNILKDIWDDRERAVCWLPRSEFGLDGATDLIADVPPEQFRAGIERLVAIAHGHLRNALDYTLLIPRKHRGVRRFCLWALGMAVPTLDNIYANPGFGSGAEVKISRREVRRIVRTYGLFAGNDRVLRRLFERASARLPQSSPDVAERLASVVRGASARFETGDDDALRGSARAG